MYSMDVHGCRLQTRTAPRSHCRVQLRTRLSVRAANPAQESSSNVCRTCGIELSKAPSGCDGQGRIIGGLGAVPGFGWWPIKAYRPCGALNAAGLEYTRKGQGTNEMLFGGVSLGETQQRSMDSMKQAADRGLEVEVEAPKQPATKE